MPKAKPDLLCLDMNLLTTDHQTISECLRAPITMRLAHRPAHSIGRPGGHASANLKDASILPAVLFYLPIQWAGVEMFEPTIKTIQTNL